MAVKVNIDGSGIAKIKHDPAVVAAIRGIAQSLRDRANGTLEQRQPYPDFDMGLQAKVPMATVFTRSNHAKYANAKRQTLVKLVGGGGGGGE